MLITKYGLILICLGIALYFGFIVASFAQQSCGQIITALETLK